MEIDATPLSATSPSTPSPNAPSPASPCSTPRRRSRGLNDEGALRAPVQVVVADHQVVARLGVCQVLSKAAGIEIVAQASHGAAALDLVRQHQPDVLLTEAALPDLSGTEIVNRLMSEDSSTTVLVFSAYSDEQAIEALLEGGIAGYLTKDEAPTQLVEAVRGVARGQDGWLSPRVTRIALRQHRRDLMLGRFGLTAREREMLAALAKGYSNRRIASTLDVSVGTVKNHLTSIYEKLGVKKRAQAIVWAYEHGVV